MLAAVRRRGVRRLVIDGLGGFAALASEPARLGHVFSALSNELRALDVATIYTAHADLAGLAAAPPLSGWSLGSAPGVADNVVILRFVELRSSVHRMISVLKMRDRASETSLREFSITDAGIVIAPDSSGAEAILAEVGQRYSTGSKLPPQSAVK